MVLNTSKFDAAYIHVLGNRPGERINLVKYKESGYYACQPFKFDNNGMTASEVDQVVADLNAGLGVPEDVAGSMYAASMFGWDKPCAAVALRYYEGGKHGNPVTT
jgi:hypothetical protein